jgi:hypothetical protein
MRCWVIAKDSDHTLLRAMIMEVASTSKNAGIDAMADASLERLVTMVAKELNKF